MISRKGVLGVTAAISSWFAGYMYITDEIDKSSSIVKQSLFNINASEIHDANLKLPVSISSGIRGKMNQFKGIANIEFDVIDKLDVKYCAQVSARRCGLNWKTNHLVLRPQEGKEIFFI